MPEAIVLQFLAAGDSGRRHLGRIHVRSGGPLRRTTSQFLSKNLNTFMDAARKRPEIASLSTTFLPGVPQQFVDVDRDKVLKQGVALNDVYRTMQTFMGGYVHQLFQPFRPAMAGVHRGGRGVPGQERKTSASFTCGTISGRKCAALRAHDEFNRAPVPNSRCASTSTARRRSTARPRRATARTRQRRRWKRCSSRRCRARWASITWACRSRNKRRAKACRRGRFSDCRCCLFF